MREQIPPGRFAPSSAGGKARIDSMARVCLGLQQQCVKRRVPPFVDQGKRSEPA
ncbi:hypothetical protein [Lignipirellula cremea]|uniref:Uncharacterized protein n=1 Tax=Lignipirellula cremea TaxID=2528010 RepID=A0A518DL17_9BACT|nr:hypothetical protein [Lignipirellula cremea]QDU92525.1 hypothetical protein Pla8534_02730 [Lignipirellula cremea]